MLVSARIIVCEVRPVGWRVGNRWQRISSLIYDHVVLGVLVLAMLMMSSCCGAIGSSSHLIGAGCSVLILIRDGAVRRSAVVGIGMICSC